VTAVQFRFFGSWEIGDWEFLCFRSALCGDLHAMHGLAGGSNFVNTPYPQAIGTIGGLQTLQLPTRPRKPPGRPRLPSSGPRQHANPTLPYLNRCLACGSAACCPVNAAVR